MLGGWVLVLIDIYSGFWVWDLFGFSVQVCWCNVGCQSILKQLHMQVRFWVLAF